MSTFISSLIKLDIYLHTCAKFQVSRPSSTISVVLPTLFLLHKLQPSSTFFLQSLLVLNSACCTLLIFLPKVFTIGEAYILSSFTMIYQVSSTQIVQNLSKSSNLQNFNQNSIIPSTVPSTIISLIFAIIIAIMFHKSTMNVKVNPKIIQNKSFSSKFNKKILKLPVLSLIILGLGFSFSCLDLTQFAIASMFLAYQNLKLTSCWIFICLSLPIIPKVGEYFNFKKLDLRKMFHLMFSMIFLSGVLSDSRTGQQLLCNASVLVLVLGLQVGFFEFQ